MGGEKREIRLTASSAERLTIAIVPSSILAGTGAAMAAALKNARPRVAASRMVGICILIVACCCC